MTDIETPYNTDTGCQIEVGLNGMFILCWVKCTGTSSIATLLNHIYLSCGQKIHIQNMVTSIQYYKNIDSFLLYYILYDLDNYTISSCCTYCVVYSSN